MGNKGDRRSRRVETPSPERGVNNTELETPNTGNETLTNLNVNIQEGLGDNISENQLAEPSQTSNEIQVWTQLLEQKSNDRITKMREEIDNKLETILKEIRSNKSMSTTTNPGQKQQTPKIHNRWDPSLLEYTHLTLKILIQKTRTILLKPQGPRI